MVKNAVITSFLGQTRDRFNEYNEPKSLEEKCRMVAGMKGVDGIEVVYPYEVNDTGQLKNLLAEYDLKIAANKVTCCPLSDGYEFSFHCNYAENWKRLVETFSEAGSHHPEVPLFIEYKPSEIRGKCFVDTGAKALCLLNDIGI